MSFSLSTIFPLKIKNEYNVYELARLVNSFSIFTGMGKVITGRLLGLDAHVFAIGRDIESLPCKAGQKMTRITVDIGDWDSTYCKILEIGPVHGLVNNAGVAHIEPFLETTQHGWDEYEYKLTF